MRVSSTTRAATDSPPSDSSHFTGQVRQQLMHEHGQATGVRVLMVRFEPGARSHWHTHAGGQVLHFVEGEGRVQTAGGEVTVVRAGDIVTAEPGEKHWHGAGPDGPTAHLALSVGTTEWMEAALTE